MFKITIEKTQPIRKTIGKQWKKVGQKEEERGQQFRVGEGPHVYLSDVMGYTPEVETVRDEIRTLLVQEVDELDLKAVIRAVNGLDGA
ncbi:hypothetical protein LCGC14_0643450 [marine sediment metagenome]|uniref:Uncharacterized protein n=1 Tax=marine sediment metagenome TaxID=412755 RepID=A0A0F9R3M2_9ZZZZ